MNFANKLDDLRADAKSILDKSEEEQYLETDDALDLLEAVAYLPEMSTMELTALLQPLYDKLNLAQANNRCEAADAYSTVIRYLRLSLGNVYVVR